MLKASQRGIITYLLVFLTSIIAWNPTNAQIQQKYFPETGHTVKGRFLEFYNRSKNPLLVYGYPITEVFRDPSYGYDVQYFQKARFEFHPDKPIEDQVILTPLGQYLYQRGQPGVPVNNVADCRTFNGPLGAFPVCMAFLDFYMAYGGPAQFGAPLSNLESQDGLTMQYFQNARFEWRPELPTGQRVQLSNLGNNYFYQQSSNPVYLRQNNNLPQTILQLNVRLFPSQNVAGLKGRQAIYIIVQDQNFQPVAKAKISLRFHLPGSDWKDVPQQTTTDKNGIAYIYLPFETKQPSAIIVEATASFDNLKGQTTGSFQTWW